MHAGVDLENLIERLQAQNKIYTIVGNAFGGYQLPVTSVPANGRDVLRLDIVTSDSSETIAGGDYADSIFTRGGDDVVNGGSGDDLIVGGTGNNVLYGDEGNDTLEGGGALYGGSGDDLLFAFREYKIFGGLVDRRDFRLPNPYQNVTIDGGQGIDTVFYYTKGLSESATFDLNLSSNVFNGTTFLNIERIQISARGANVTLIGGDLDDKLEGVGVLEGRSGNDTIRGLGNISGGNGNDYLIGSGRVTGGAGNDTVVSSGNMNNSGYGYYGGYGTYDGGQGYDTLHMNFFGTGGAFVNLGQETTLPNEILVRRFEYVNIIGSADSDHLFGGDFGDDFDGRSGDDSIVGGGGNDTLTGGIGNDYISGGDGDDLISGGTGNNTLVGGAGDDIISGSDRIYGNTVGSTIVLSGKQSDYNITGTAQKAVFEDRRDNGDGTDHVSSVQFAQFSDGKVSISKFFSSTIIGDDQNNDFIGDEGNNTIWGYGGSDELLGNGGDDTLIGGAGKDELVGGAGADVFVFGPNDSGIGGWNRDLIYDFVSGTDRIDLSAFGPEMTYHVSPIGSGVYLRIDADGDGQRDMDIEIRFQGAFGPTADDIII